MNKYAGVLIPLFALREDDDYGIADTNSLIKTIEFFAKYHVNLIQLLPINETGPDNSPYNAISSQALDPIYISFDKSQLSLVDDEISKQIKNSFKLSDNSSVDYEYVKEFKLSILELLFEKKFDNPNFKKQYDIFCSQNDNWLKTYSLYRALLELNNNNPVWTEWLKQYQEYDTAKIYFNQFKNENNLNEVTRLKPEFWAFVQTIAHQQWSNVRLVADKYGVKLIGDMPFGVSRYSSDVWANKNLFNLEWSCGAPPETYFKGDDFVRLWGQNWGMPLYNWSIHEKENYDWWRLRVEAINKIFHGYRIDHVLGFFRVYAFPWLPQNNEKYLNMSLEDVKHELNGNYPQFLPHDDETEESEKLNLDHGFKILSKIKEFSKDSIIIAEDLGVVPKYVRPALKQLNIGGFTIPQFERNKDYTYKSIDTYPEINLVTYATHDHEPMSLFYQHLVEWWHGPDGNVGWLEVGRLMQFLNLDQNNPPLEFNDEIHCALLNKLFQTKCQYKVLMITDLLGLNHKFNQPGTNSNSNWSRRLEYDLDFYANTEPFHHRIELFSKLISSNIK